MEEKKKKVAIERIREELERIDKKENQVMFYVIDTEGYDSYVRQAVSRGVYVYGYLNVGALEKERPYYDNR